MQQESSTLISISSTQLTQGQLITRNISVQAQSQYHCINGKHMLRFFVVARSRIARNVGLVPVKSVMLDLP